MDHEWDWSLVDKVVYINLQQRSDRNEEIKKELEKVKVPADKIIRFEAITNHAGHIGCVKSHLAVLKMAQEQRWKNVLVLEDDMVFEAGDAALQRANHYFMKLKTIAWDVAFLSASYYIVNDLGEGLFRVKFAYLSNSYLVNHHYYQTLIDNYTESVEKLEQGGPNHKYGLDSHWMKIMQTDHWYGVYPCLGFQRAGMSDIEHREMDRTMDFSRTLDDMRRYGSY